MFFQKPNFALAFSFITHGMAYAFFVITIPTIGRKLDFSDTNTGLILGLSALIITLASPMWGIISESWGRRNVIIVSMLATAVFTVGSALIIHFRLANLLSLQSAFIALLAIRLLNSLFTGGLKPAGQAYVSDTTSKEERAKGMGLIGAAFGIGSIMGGIAAMVSGSEHLMKAYVVITVLLLLSSAVNALRLHETHMVTTKPEHTQPLPYRQIWFFLLLTVIGLLVFSLLQHVVGLTLQDKFQLSADQAVRRSGMTMMLTMLVMIVTQLFLVRKLKMPPNTLILYGIFIAIISLVLASALILSPLNNIALLVFAISLFGLGLGLALPGNLASLSITVNSYSQARVAGINGIGQGLGLALGPVLATSLHKASYAAPYLVGVALLVLLLALFALNTKQQGTQPSST